MPKQTNENQYLKSLTNHLKTLTPPPDLSDVAKYLQIQKRSFLKYFPNPKSGKTQEPFPLKIVRGLYIGFQFPAEKFLLSKEEQQQYFGIEGNKDTGKYFLKEDDLFTQWSSHFNDLEEFHHLNYSTKLSPQKKDEFLKQYSLFFEKYFQAAEKILGVYEYVGKGKKTMPEYLGIYEKAREAIFATIEKKLIAQREISYTRYIALPYTMNSLEKASRTSFKEAAMEALILCSVPVFGHIFRCLYNIQSEKGGRSIRFYVVKSPWRPYNFGIIENENEKYVLSEYFRYSQEGGLLPDLLFILSVKSKEIGLLFRVYKEEMYLFSKENKDYYFKSFRQFQEIFNDAYSKVEKSAFNTEKTETLKLMNLKKAILDQKKE